MNVTRPNLVFLLQLPENTRWILCKPCVLVCVCACVWVWLREPVCVCVFMCEAVCVCEQVAIIFEDDSRGLTHARPNKVALWWSLCVTLSLGLWGLSLTHMLATHTHSHAHTRAVPHFPCGATRPLQIAKVALWLLRLGMRLVCGLMTTRCTLSARVIYPSRHLCTRYPQLTCPSCNNHLRLFWNVLNAAFTCKIKLNGLEAVGVVRHAKLEKPQQNTQMTHAQSCDNEIWKLY